MKLEYETLTYTKAGRTAVVNLSRPQKLNAINQRMIDEFADLTTNVWSRDDGVRAIVITGQGRAFSAGADLTEAPGQAGNPANPVAAYAFSRKYQKLCDSLEALPQPVIAAINGLAFGGGCELAMACDLRIASEEALIGVPEVDLGGMPGGGATQRLPRLVGAARAKQMLFLGKPISAQEALSWGLLNKVTSIHELMDEALALARTLAEKRPLSLARLKTLVNRSWDVDLAAGLEIEAQSVGIVLGTPLEEPAASWRGRQDHPDS